MTLAAAVCQTRAVSRDDAQTVVRRHIGAWPLPDGTYYLAEGDNAVALMFEHDEADTVFGGLRKDGTEWCLVGYDDRPVRLVQPRLFE